MKTGILFDIQRFAVHDGPGIRSTVFLKGCSCRCGWCHNPESLSVAPQIEFYPSRCIGCGKCFSACPKGAHIMKNDEHVIDREKCIGCGKCADTCYADALVCKGRTATLDDVLQTILADKAYYQESGGGVTISGGEPVLQSDFTLEILKACKDQGIHTAIQTAGNYPFELLESLLPYLDLVMYDMKGFAPEIYKWHIRGNRDQIMGNLLKMDAIFEGEIAVRTPCVGTVNATAQEIEAMAKFIAPLKHLSYYQLMPYHGLGKAKYDALDAHFEQSYQTPTPETIAQLESVAAQYVSVFNIDKGITYPS